MSITRSELDELILTKYDPAVSKIQRVANRMSTVSDNINLLNNTATLLLADIEICEDQLHLKRLTPELLRIRLDTITKMLEVVAGAYEQLRVDEKFIENYYDNKDALLADLRSQIDLISGSKVSLSDVDYLNKMKVIMEDTYRGTTVGFKSFEAVAPRYLLAYQSLYQKSIDGTARIQSAHTITTPAPSDKSILSKNKNTQFGNTAANNSAINDQAQTTHKKAKKKSNGGGGCNIM